MASVLLHIFILNERLSDLLNTAVSPLPTILESAKRHHLTQDAPTL